MRFQLFSFFFFRFCSLPPKKKVPCGLTKGWLFDHFLYFLLPPPPMHCCCIWNVSWFWASQIKANALIYCHRYCNSVIHTSSTSADFQPFKWRIMAYGWFWSASPAGEENKLIFRAHLFCVDPKLSRTWTFLFFFFPFHFFFFAQQQSILKHFLEKRRVQFLCIHFKRRWWFATEVYGVIASHLTPCHRHFITVKINRPLFIPKSKNDSLSFLGCVSKNYFFLFFFLCCTGNTNELCLSSLAPLWKCGHFIL